MKKSIYVIFIFFTIISCTSKETPLTGKPFLLTELTPGRGTPVPTATPESDGPVIVKYLGVIVEIEIDNGVQVGVYMKMEQEARGLPSGTIGSIYEDETLAKKVGTFKIVEEFPGFYYGKLVETFYTVKIEHPVEIQIEK